MHGFSLNFQGMFTARGSTADYVFGGGGYPVTTVAMATLLRWVVKLVAVPQPKPMNGFSPNFQGMFTTRG